VDCSNAATAEAVPQAVPHPAHPVASGEGPSCAAEPSNQSWEPSPGALNINNIPCTFSSSSPAKWQCACSWSSLEKRQGSADAADDLIASRVQRMAKSTALSRCVRGLLRV
jgi:hypothetical protein